MGHAHVLNLSEAFVRRLYAKGKVSIKEVAEACLQKGETLHASEGEYEEKFMICHGLEDVVLYLLSAHKFTPRSKPTPVIEPVGMTEEQERIFEEWATDAMFDWDCGDDGESGQYGVLDSIQFRFAPEWRKRYPDVPLLESVSH